MKLDTCLWLRMRAAALAALTFPTIAAAEELPLDPAVTQETIGQTICAVGWTKTIRPSAAKTAIVKARLLRAFGIPQEQAVAFELDHRIPLALGGAPADPRNLELQPGDEAVEKSYRGLLGPRRLRRQARPR